MQDTKTFTLKIVLQPEDLELDKENLLDQLYQYQAGDYSRIVVEAEQQGFYKDVMEIAEKTIADNLAQSKPSEDALIKKRIQNLDNLLSVFWANLSDILAQLVTRIFTDVEGRVVVLVAAQSVIQTWRFAHYTLSSYLEPVIFADMAEKFGFPALASFMRRYRVTKEEITMARQGYDEQAAEYRKILDLKPDTYLIHAGLDGAKGRHIGYAYIYLSSAMLGVSEEILQIGPKPNIMTGYYAWYRYFVPQIIGYCLRRTFTAALPLSQFHAALGLKMDDYEGVGFA